MDIEAFKQAYDFSGRTVVITGGAGILCSEMTAVLVDLGANVAVLDLRPEQAQTVLQEKELNFDKLRILECNVLEPGSVQKAVDETLDAFGAIDALINGAGGNHPKATTSLQLRFFDIPADTFGFVLNLNLLGTVIPSQVVASQMAEQKKGVILNISSMNAFRPLTKIPAYSAAKAAVSNFTQWLAVHLAQEYSGNIRVNALAPGFFLTDQNRFLLTDEKSGELTPRGKTILSHTPMGRFGEPGDLIGTMLWLLSPTSAFVTGIVVPVDGGFSAFSGV